MDQKPQDPVQVRVSVLRGVLKIGNINIIKIDSLLRGHYMGDHLFGEYDLTTLADVRASSYTLTSYLEELIDQAVEANVKHVYLPQDELKVIITLTNALTVAQMAKISNTNLREH